MVTIMVAQLTTVLHEIPQKLTHETDGQAERLERARTMDVMETLAKPGKRNGTGPFVAADRIGTPDAGRDLDALSRAMDGDELLLGDGLGDCAGHGVNADGTCGCIFTLVTRRNERRRGVSLR
jgi:hypothetical protein